MKVSVSGCPAPPLATGAKLRSAAPLTVSARAATYAGTPCTAGETSRQRAATFSRNHGSASIRISQWPRGSSIWLRSKPSVIQLRSRNQSVGFSTSTPLRFPEDWSKSHGAAIPPTPPTRDVQYLLLTFESRFFIISLVG